MANAVKTRVSADILGLIGNTPMVQLHRVVEPDMARVLAKLESFNPGGSVKDRICLSMIEDAEHRGLLKPGSTVVEPTSGNTGIGLAMICARKGYRSILTMPETMTAERLEVLKRYGADVVLTAAADGMIGAVQKAERLLQETPGAFMPQQFKNPANPDIHRRTTAQEILRAVDGDIHALVLGVGTGGTLTGVGEVLKKRFPHLRVVAVEPERSPVLSGGAPGQHMIQGIGAGFVPEVLNRGLIDEVLTVSDESAYQAARRLAREEGISVGISSGAACWAALRVAKHLGSGHTIVTVFPDGWERYLSIQPYFEE